MNEINEKCSCGSRLKHKCVKESDSGSGKMCVKTIFEQIDSGKAWVIDFNVSKEVNHVEN